MQLTDRDRILLAFVADHRLVLTGHVQVLLGKSDSAARGRLGALSRAGYLAQHRLFHRQPACYQVTRRGLAAIGSDLPRPRIDLRSYMHDVGLGWLWLSARAGSFGPVSEVLSERQLRSRDGLPGSGRERLAVRMFGFGPGGREQLHYPDLLLRTPDGKRIAIELELTAKGRTRREKILSGYGADRRIDLVVYLVNRPEVARSVRASAAKLGMSDLVHVQPFAWTPSMQRLDRHLSAGSTRAPARSAAGASAGGRSEAAS
ncbi:MAG: hypothetical protein QOD66_3362 [Solirubrobacteraceae bacterium]|nr:hypothetical protein [Solirubrobacteraceae bacterium]